MPFARSHRDPQPALADPPRVSAPKRKRDPSTVGVRERFKLIAKRFIPGASHGIRLVVQYRLIGADGGNWVVTVNNGKISVRSGSVHQPDLFYESSTEVYRKLDDGEMNLAVAYVTRKFKFSGDWRDAIRYAAMFRPLETVL